MSLSAALVAGCSVSAINPNKTGAAGASNAAVSTDKSIFPLDSSFNTSGYNSVAVTNISYAYYGTGIQSDGKILLAGVANNAGKLGSSGATTTRNDWAVIRYNTDGSLDTTYNGTGTQRVAFNTYDDNAYSITLQPDDKAVLCGVSDSGTWVNQFAIARMTTAGALDGTFGAGGKFQVTWQNYDFADNCLIQSDGKIVVVGTSYDGSSWNMGITRLTSAGALDATWNGTGKYRAVVGTAPTNTQIYAVKQQTDGKIVIAGSTNAGGTKQFFAARFTTAGVLDATFNATGKVQIPIVGSTAAEAYSMALQTDGKIVLAGYATVGGYNDLAVARLNTNGSIDATFGAGNGYIYDQALTTSGDQINAVTIQSDGKILAAGSGYTTTRQDSLVVRYNSDGTRDMSYGVGGIWRLQLASADSGIYSIGLQSNGQYVFGGYDTNSSSQSQFLGLRFLVQ